MQPEQIIEFKLRPAQPELVVANLRSLVLQVPALEAAHDQIQAAAQQRI